MKHKTKKQCQEEIDELNNVCNRCGRKIVPLKTENNAGEPTYSSGCMHGKTDGSWGHFTHGVKKETYEIAVKLVLLDSIHFGMERRDIELSDFDYAWQNAVYKACELIDRIEYAKNSEPQNTKESLKKQYFKDT